MGHLERGCQAAHRIELGYRGEQLRGGVGVLADSREFVSRSLSRGQRPLQQSLHFVDAAEPTLKLRRGAGVACGAACLGDLLPCRCRRAEIAAELGALPEPLEKGEAPRLIVRRPDLQRATKPVERVAVRVRRVEVLCRGNKGRPGARRLLRRRPMLGEDRRPRSSVREQLGHPPVQLAPPPPRDVAIERLARERVAECRDARLDLDEDAGDRVVDRRLAGELGHE